MSNTFSAIRNNEACQSPSTDRLHIRAVGFYGGLFPTRARSDFLLALRAIFLHREKLFGIQAAVTVLVHGLEALNQLLLHALRGRADEHDSPKQGIEREVLEESGYVVDAVKLVAIKDRHLHPYTPQRLERIYKLFFLCEVRGGAPQASIETSEVGWFYVDDLPELSVGRTLAADVELLFNHQQQRSLPVTFD